MNLRIANVFDAIRSEALTFSSSLVALITITFANSIVSLAIGFCTVCLLLLKIRAEYKKQFVERERNTTQSESANED